MLDEMFESRVKIQQIIENQLPEFILDESPKAAEFLKQYYISQEFQGGSIDIAENLDQYLKIDNLTPEVVTGFAELTSNISSTADVIFVNSTKGFPKKYGLIKIDDEIITYTGTTATSFIGCIRGFSGITNYHQENNPDELVFSTSDSANHITNTENPTKVINLSSLFLKEFYKKIKFTFTPGLEDADFVSNLDVSNFIKEARSLYKAKGTEESFKILFKVLYGQTPKVIDLEQFLIKPSSAQYIRREIILVERISGDPLKLVGQTIRREKDSYTQASVSEVEILTRNNNTYYKLSLFVGYNEKELIEGTFKIAGKTKCLEDIDPSNVNSNNFVITVDSTLGFDDSGTIVCQSIEHNLTNVISYTNKTVNQFLGCSGLTTKIPVASIVRSDEIVYGYENGDLTKKVEVRITGILSKFTSSKEITLVNESEKIYVKNLGDYVENVAINPSYKEIFTNTWIYNTSCRYELEDIVIPETQSQKSISEVILKTACDKSSLDVGDTIEILNRATKTVLSTHQITSITKDQINNENKIVKIVPSLSLQELGKDPQGNIVYNRKYDIRRKVKKSLSNIVPLEYNGDILSNVQNVYIDDSSSYAYVVSNGLPEYPINIGLTTAYLDNPNWSIVFEDYDLNTQSYSTIRFINGIVPFVSGDSVVYKSDGEAIGGLISNSKYYVEVLAGGRIKLYSSRSFVETNNSVPLKKPQSSTGYHTFTLEKQKSNLISIQKNFKKFPLTQNLQNGASYKTNPGAVGMLINGVEIFSYKSQDKVFYGPLTKVNVLNSGNNYDVVNEPKIIISPPASGTQALVQPILTGSVVDVLVEPQDFDVLGSVSASLIGGNGSGAILKPIISERYREIVFDGRLVSNGGGINTVTETITFKNTHNLFDGEVIIYNSNNNKGIGVGTYFGGSEFTGFTLVTNSSYYVKKVDSKSIKIYNSYSDYNSGINTVGFTTENTSGLHKFRTIDKYTLKSIKVLNSGSGYTNKKLYVNPLGISSSLNIITYENHHFNDGDVVVYSYEDSGTPTSGLSTEVHYKVIKIDQNRFRLADVGAGSTDNHNYVSKNFVAFSSVGTGYQIFSYPPIEVVVDGIFNNSETQSINAVPIVRGEITDTYLYEPGTGYGSTVLNLEKQPIIRIATGKDAEVFPVIKNGKIVDVNVNFGGYEYYSVPDLIVTGTGSGAILKAIVENQRITNVVVINPGSGYDNTTKIKVSSPGNKALFNVKIRDLTINERTRYAKDEIFAQSKESLKYGIVSYPKTIATSYLRDVEDDYSPIIGWAYDGNPIYGPYASGDPTNGNDTVRLITSGYTYKPEEVFDRPFIDGVEFVEDYVFNNSGDLDQYNGRFAVTNEFPKGVYAYHATLDFPYFVGDSYRSEPISENFLLDKEVDINELSLNRNTFPYCLDLDYVDNDFIVESNEIINQSTIVESVSRGSVESLEIVNSGDNYKIGESLVFDSEGTSGGGVQAKISEIKGKSIISIASSTVELENSILVWNNNKIKVITNTFHNFKDGDIVTLSGVSTYIGQLTKSYKIGVNTESISLMSEIPPSASSGIVTDIFVSYIPDSVSVGSSIKIYDEIFSILNIFKTNSVLRVKRGISPVFSYPESCAIDILQNSFSISEKTDYFASKQNNKVFFNPKFSVGVGTTPGLGISTSYSIGKIGITTGNISIPTQSIYLPDHPFVTGEEIQFTPSGSAISVKITPSPSSSIFDLPNKLYVINKSKDFIGLTTQVGFTTNTSGLFFITNGSNSYEYSFETKYSQVKSKVTKSKAIVSISTNHNLRENDIVNLNVRSNLSVGIGSSSRVRVTYNPTYNKILINPLGFTTTGINTFTNTITLPSHGFKTGDKVFYDVTSGNIASGLNTGGFYVYKIDDNNIQLGKSFYDVSIPYPDIINITSSGGNNHRLSLINPEIVVSKNSNIVFDTSDHSVSGYEFGIFYDNQFNNRIISAGLSTVFNVISIGSSTTLNYDENIPSILYYTLLKDGDIISPDLDVQKYNQILYKNSVYNGTYNISGVGASTFEICLSDIPERSLYTNETTDNLEYTTKSKTAYGGISKINLLYGGLNYKKLPKFIEVNSEYGFGANIVPNSKSIGNISKVRFLEQGFDYPSDKTLKPTAEISPFIIIKDSNSVEKINIIKKGNNYIIPPSLIIYNTETNEVADSSSLSCNISSGSIVSVNLNQNPYGLKDSVHKVVSINNSNGIGINNVQRDSDTQFTLSLTTPIIGGYSKDVFSPGDQVFIEGIETIPGSGSGYNSEDYGYEFLTVKEYNNTIPATVSIDVSEYTNKIGLAVTNGGNFPYIVNRYNYPEFEIIEKKSRFLKGEKLLVDNQEKSLYIVESQDGFIKVSGKYTPKIGQILKGKISGITGTIVNIDFNRGKFEINYSNEATYGWLSDIGKLSETYQVCPNNDYYQNLSYTVKSEIQFEELIDPVNRLVHTAGLKNFADTEVISKASIGIGSTSSDVTVLDVLGEKRVDTIYNFDEAIDINIKQNKSKFIKLKNRKISDYFKCLTNRVLVIDDISNLFDDSETNQSFISQQFSDLDILDTNFARYLIQIRNPDTGSIEFSEIVILVESPGTEEDNIIILEKGALSSENESFGKIEVKTAGTQRNLRFTPTNIYDNNFDIKILDTKFSTIGFSSSAYDIGFVELASYKNTVPTGTTQSLVSFNKDKYRSLFANIHLVNNTKNTSDYIELFVVHDGTDVYSADYYFDNNKNISNKIIGNLEPKLIGNNFILTFYNNDGNDVVLSSKIVGFGTTSVGEGIYRFKASNQADGDERSARIETHYDVATSIGEVVTIDINDSSCMKSLVKVSCGKTSSLHQVMTMCDSENTYVLEYPYVSIGHTVGMGTFGAITSGSSVILNFYVDPDISGPVEIESYNEILYTDWDNSNEYADLNYTPIIEKIELSSFNGLNKSRVNQYSFDMNYENIPIFMKSFNPTNTLNQNTGIFSIKDHFFSPGEKVFYRAERTQNTESGLSASPIKITTSPSYPVPSEVYICPITKDSFGIATTRQEALDGNYITSFASVGVGNSHKLEMEKKNEKVIISIDGVVQQPLTYTSVVYNLSNNGGQVSASSTYFSISGISTINIGDILNIDNEFMKIVSVGLGTTSVGPITEQGDFGIVNVERGLFDSVISTHNDGKQSRVYKGVYNIVGNKLYFTTPPKGAGSEDVNESNLPYPTAKFSGRAFLQQNYQNNKIFDDISSEFNGIGRTFTLKSNGNNITGINTGNGFIFINDIFQTPTTLNNSDNNFEIIQGVSGVSSAVFSGITTQIGSNPIVIDYDVNQNQLPRGGVIVSLGSTPGLGFAPLVGASVTAVIGSGGAIVAVGVGSTDYSGSGYNRQVSVAVTDSSGYGASISAVIGIGGTLSFVVNNGGTGYTNPKVIVSQPSYENMPVIGVSRFGQGSTTKTGDNLLLNLSVGAIATTGIGSTLFAVTSFSIARQGYNFKVGDVIKPVGLVTDRNLAAPLINCEFTVTSVFNDSFYGLELGEFDFIDSIKNLQDGSRKTFPLYYSKDVRSFEKDSTNPLKLDASLIIFVNGIIQEPGISYQFDGGTSLTFAIPPKPEDEISIFFYQGQKNIDVIQENVIETIKSGDDVQLFKNDSYPNTTTQSIRLVENIENSDEISTNLYIGSNLDDIVYKPLAWTKQKVDRIISGQETYKFRDSLEPLIFPTANIIKNLSTTDSVIFVDNSELFRVDTNENSIGGLIIPGISSDPVAAAFTATINSFGQVVGITTTNVGFGYTQSTLNLKFSSPYYKGVGIGETALGTVSILNGSIKSYSITNAGSGYTYTHPPQVIVQSPKINNYELVSGISTIKGFSGIVVGIHTVSVGSSHKIIFDLKVDEKYSNWIFDMQVGYPIYISQTQIGSPSSSLDINDLSTVGIGTTCLDNIYIIHSLAGFGQTVAVRSYINNNLVGISSYDTDGIGRFSWGLLGSAARGLKPVELKVKGFTASSGLSTYPLIQRRSYGFRSTGAVYPNNS